MTSLIAAESKMQSSSSSKSDITALSITELAKLGNVRSVAAPALRLVFTCFANITELSECSVTLSVS